MLTNIKTLKITSDAPAVYLFLFQVLLNTPITNGYVRQKTQSKCLSLFIS